MPNDLKLVLYTWVIIFLISIPVAIYILKRGGNKKHKPTKEEKWINNTAIVVFILIGVIMVAEPLSYFNVSSGAADILMLVIMPMVIFMVGLLSFVIYKLTNK